MLIRSAPMATVVTVAAIAWPAAAGPDFIEDCSNDTGSLPGSAKPVTGPGPLVARITGCLDSTAPFTGPPDFEDMYLINIQDPASFQAFTLAGDGTNDDDTTFNSQLWLFAGPDFGQEAGNGLLGNQQGRPRLPPGSAALGPASTDGTGVVISEPGLYYLAITEIQNVPLADEGPIFQFLEPFEISGPDGPGQGLRISDWSGPRMAAGGTYTIFLDGVVPVIVPGDTNFDGRVDVNDLVNVVALWGTGGQAPGINADVNGDGTVDVNDLNEVVVHWSP